MLESVPNEADMLDLGCGSGGIAHELVRRGHRGKYMGLDFSEELLGIARSNVQGPELDVQFIASDLTAADWHRQSPISNLRFDFIFAFAVLHHLPSQEIRLSFLKPVHNLLSPGGRFVLSNWQFLNSPRLRKRIQPWEIIGLSESDMDDGDYLLDWLRGGTGLRYVHHFNEAELAQLASDTGFQIVDQFQADGKTGNLALYQVWIAVQNDKQKPGL